MENPISNYNQVFCDHRGHFAPISLKYGDNSSPELRKEWLQSNISVNPKRYTLRGLHFQVGDFAQAKLIKVINGMIYDFVVDIREDSPNYMELYIYDMVEGDELYVPRGFAHGFITLKENTIVQYLVDNVYSPESEGSIVWTEFPELVELFHKFDYNFNVSDIVVSDKDLYTKNFKNGKSIHKITSE